MRWRHTLSSMRSTQHPCLMLMRRRSPSSTLSTFLSSCSPAPSWSFNLAHRKCRSEAAALGSGISSGALAPYHYVQPQRCVLHNMCRQTTVSDMLSWKQAGSLQLQKLACAQTPGHHSPGSGCSWASMVEAPSVGHGPIGNPLLRMGVPLRVCSSPAAPTGCMLLTWRCPWCRCSICHRRSARQSPERCAAMTVPWRWSPHWAQTSPGPPPRRSAASGTCRSPWRSWTSS